MEPTLKRLHDLHKGANQLPSNPRVFLCRIEYAWHLARDRDMLDNLDAIALQCGHAAGMVGQ
jgi:hypothetical protein